MGGNKAIDTELKMVKESVIQNSMTMHSMKTLSEVLREEINGFYTHINKVKD